MKISHLYLLTLLLFACSPAKKAEIQAEKLFQQRQLQEALDKINEAIILDTLRSSAHYMKSEILSTMDSHNESLTAIKRAIDIDNSKPQYYDHLGKVYSNLSKYQEALQANDRSIEIKESAKGYYNRGETYRDMGSPLRAIGDFEKSIELDSFFYLSQASLGEIYQDQKNFVKAHYYYDKALNAFETGPYPKQGYMRAALILGKALTYYHQGDLAAACQLMSQVDQKVYPLADHFLKTNCDE